MTLTMHPHLNVKKMSIQEINEMLFISSKLVPVVTELELKTIFDIDFS